MCREHQACSARPRCIDLLLLTAVLALAACGASPTAPDAGAPHTPQGTQAALRVIADPVIDMTPGESRALEIEELDSTARPVRHPASMYDWSSSDTNIIAVDGAGLMRAGPGLGEAIVTARSSEAAVRVWVQVPEGVASGFRITLVYGDGVPDEWRPRFQFAADRWERVIRASLPPIVVEAPARSDASCHGLPQEMLTGIETGTRVFIGRHENVGTGGGVCLARPMPSPTSAVGWIKVGGLNDPTPFLPDHWLTVHEMGHALGLVGVFPAPHPSWIDRTARIYKGPLALEGHRRQFARTIDSLSLDGGHWQFFEDVMSTQRRILTISQVTVGALMDLGYPAAWYGADRR